MNEKRGEAGQGQDPKLVVENPRGVRPVPPHKRPPAFSEEGVSMGKPGKVSPGPIDVKEVAGK